MGQSMAWCRREANPAAFRLAAAPRRPLGVVRAVPPSSVVAKLASVPHRASRALGFRGEMSYALIGPSRNFAPGSPRRLWMLAYKSGRFMRPLAGLGVVVGVSCAAGAALAQTPPPAG